MSILTSLLLSASILVQSQATNSLEDNPRLPDEPPSWPWNHNYHPTAQDLLAQTSTITNVLPLPPSDLPISPLPALHAALTTLQSLYFTLHLGTYPTAIDWTAAVTATHLTATLSTLSHSSASPAPPRIANEISKYFAHLSSFYFGQDAFSIMFQAYDDMLWVVLGWLDGVKFAGGHEGGVWHGVQFSPAFAHRARVFYELAQMGWEEGLCGGGMLWAPGGLPYKNAVTNELWVAAYD